MNANGDLIGYNMYAYCSNNPVMYVDPSGRSVIGVVSFIAVALLCVFLLTSCESPSSDVGAAPPYVEMQGGDRTSPNCYAYAIGSDKNEQPGLKSGRYPRNTNDVYDVGLSVEADLKAMGYTVRRISGPNDKVYDDEYKIALRVGTRPYAYHADSGMPLYDYHFMRQTNTGQWAEKHGSEGSTYLWPLGETPDTVPWTLGGLPYYDSDIIYYAISK